MHGKKEKDAHHCWDRCRWMLGDWQSSGAALHKGERLHRQLVRASAVLRRCRKAVFKQQMKSFLCKELDVFQKVDNVLCEQRTRHLDIFYLILLFHCNYSAAQPFVLRPSDGIHQWNASMVSSKVQGDCGYTGMAYLEKKQSFRRMKQPIDSLRGVGLLFLLQLTVFVTCALSLKGNSEETCKLISCGRKESFLINYHRLGGLMKRKEQRKNWWKNRQTKERMKLPPHWKRRQARVKLL